MDNQDDRAHIDEPLESSTHVLVDNISMNEHGHGNQSDAPERMVLYNNDTESEETYNIVASDESGTLLLRPDGSVTGATASSSCITEVGDSQDHNGLELIQISSFSDITGDGTKLWHIVPNNVNLPADSVVLVGDQTQSISHMGGAGDSPNFSLINTSQTRAPPAGAPQWAKIINDCERVGHYYRGWVPTEQDLDIVLTLHKQQTSSFWGTRQSPAGNRPSARLMWKSQYVPFDGIPFINCGSRATVMECQFGPRRRGARTEVKGDGVFIDFKHSCPARIYVKKVRKFPEFAIPSNLDRRMQKQMMDKSFQALRSSSPGGGEDRFYMQLPSVNAHEYHTLLTVPKHSLITRTYDVSTIDHGNSRLAEPVAGKIREIVASGIHHTTTIRKMLRKYVEKDLFQDEEPPVRHDLSYFPTVSDLKNHIHTALLDIENGTLPLREASVDTLAIDQDQDWTSNWANNIAAQPQTVTVTLTQTDESVGHCISRVETHMSDGSTQVSSSLTPETAALLARLHPNMFPSLQGELHGGKEIEGDKITQLVQSVLLRSTENEPSPNISSVQEPPHPTEKCPVADSAQNLENGGLSEPTPPTEGVQLDLELHETTHDVTEVTLEGE